MTKPKNPPRETAAETDKKVGLEAKAKRIKDSVAAQTLKRIGTPKNMRRVDVYLYQPGRARINIWQEKPGKELVTTRLELTDSHYLWLTKEATIAKSNPPMKPKYV